MDPRNSHPHNRPLPGDRLWGTLERGIYQMRTRSPSKLFDPELAKAQVRPIIEIATPLLKEVLSYGMVLFARCSYRPEGDDENLAILFIYRTFWKWWTV